MRIFVWACLGFTLGLGGATVVLALRGPDAGAEADELVADSASVALADSAALAAADSAAAADSVDTAAVALSAVALSAAADAKEPRQDPAPGIAPAARDTAPAGWTDKDASAAAARVAKIFGAMEAQDAARVLELLQNNQVQTILAHMSERKVAAILVHLDPARAAELSRQAMRPPETH
jgi:hypothetical protein